MTRTIDERDALGITRAPLGATRVFAIVVAIAAGVLAFIGADDRGGQIAGAAAVLVIAWSLASISTAFTRPGEPLCLWLAVTALVGGAALKSQPLVGLVPLALALLAVALPDCIVTGPERGSVRRFLATIAVMGVPFAAVVSAMDDRGPMIAIESCILGAVAVIAYTLRCRKGSAIDRARLQWAGWGVVVASGLVLLVWLMHVLVGWPDGIGAPVAVVTIVVPFAIALSAIERLALRIDRLLVRTIETAGLILLVGAVYVVVVVGFGDSPDDASRRTLGLSLIAAGIAALFFVPARNRLEEIANRRVYGDRNAPDEPIQSFGARMSRAIPLDELLLQLAESLKKSLQLVAAEVWTGTDGRLEQAAAVPFRHADRVKLAEEEVAVVARGHRVSGNAWIQVWLPAFIDQHPGRVLRVMPLVHSGELLGLILCARTPDQQPFTEEDERVLTELARQVALALHNSALDTALQASLDELRVTNEELRASRARIVATADQSRRQIERNLHDGAQQHLVALAVKLGLARQLVGGDPDALTTLLEELRGDAQTTLTELRELAHGIYPPLLMDRGLSEALRAAANRSVLPTDVDADVGRFPPEVEAAVYFCVLEALQNAGKHAGEGARLTVTVAGDDHELTFSVRDDGAGFDTTTGAIRGHGFVNMEDRLGAIGGVVKVDSAPGAGTTISGPIPLTVSALRETVPD